jgi:hypothetical protein
MRYNKYRNQPVTVNGTLFASKLEGRRYQELTLVQSAGEIRDLQLQVPFNLVVNNQHVGRYIADFCYYDLQGKRHVEDCKGVRTAVYQLKKKLMRAIYGIAIEEVN